MVQKAKKLLNDQIQNIYLQLCKYKEIFFDKQYGQVFFTSK